MHSNPPRSKDVFDNLPPLEHLEWQPFHKGVSIFRLYGNQETGPSAALLKYERGAGVPIHEHLGNEHIFILRGAQSDHRGEYPAGTMLTNPPGSSHAVHNEHGSIVLVMWEQPVRFHDK